MFESRIGSVQPSFEAQDIERRREVQRQNEQVSIGWAPMVSNSTADAPLLVADTSHI